MMDLKGLTWIGNIYDKFEAMCLEMEEVMYEDTVKYVENQVQTVGAGVKRFYSEVVKDLHSDSYVDPVKVAAADLSLNPYAHSKMKLKANAKKDGRDTNWELSDESKVISGKSKTGVYRRPVASRKSNSMANFMPPVSGPIAPFSENLRNLSSFSQMKKSRQMASGCVDVLSPSAGVEEGSRIANEKLCKPMVDTSLPMSRASSPSAGVEDGSRIANEKLCKPMVDTSLPMSCASWPSAGVEEGSRIANEKLCKPMVDTSLPMSRASFNSPATATKTIVSVVSAGQKQAASSSTSSSDGLSSESSAVGTCTNSGVVSQTEKTSATGTDSMKSVEEDVFMAHQERLDDYSVNAAKNDDTMDPEVEIIEPFNESKLEETCVLVEEDELHSFPQGKGNHKSYKKKIREAFSSKMRLKKKEYEQLAVRCTEQNSNQEGAEKAMTDRPAESNTKSFPAPSSETEWELV